MSGFGKAFTAILYFLAAGFAWFSSADFYRVAIRNGTGVLDTVVAIACTLLLLAVGTMVWRTRAVPTWQAAGVCWVAVAFLLLGTWDAVAAGDAGRIVAYAAPPLLLMFLVWCIARNVGKDL
ncbi:hypothetical protein [Candidatus Frankia nodulisporulans]|uniref:hypothetical protein n=1 Tax=Candidatus Frankia nodulisporulans TaxID=2060052 RepID=UPI0013CF435D|nr:hypothetical protein [Candidatus Frankia nodulisporulans]